MVNETEDDASKGETKHISDRKKDKPLKDFNTTAQLQERLNSLESRIKVVKLDFKTQVEGLRSRIEHLKSDLEIVQVDLNSKKTRDTRNDNEVRGILCRKDARV